MDPGRLGEHLCRTLPLVWVMFPQHPNELIHVPFTKSCPKNLKKLYMVITPAYTAQVKKTVLLSMICYIDEITNFNYLKKVSFNFENILNTF